MTTKALRQRYLPRAMSSALDRRSGEASWGDDFSEFWGISVQQMDDVHAVRTQHVKGPMVGGRAGVEKAR